MICNIYVFLSYLEISCVSVCVCFLETEGLQFEVPHLACSVYYGALKDLPAMVRLWWNSQEKRVFSTVDKFTSKYVSSVLSAQEIASVQSSTQTFENMMVSPDGKFKWNKVLKWFIAF